ncbi:TRAP transporter large permease [Ruegeria arenilitoris]|uniref:TRAP transporter large permease n=1 Tax=Ruegeria arenilitoris TaxID=1173585 RepID=UPI002670434B|nr:TRAP transporter large permease subunit [Ruegeria arenilitoris]
MFACLFVMIGFGVPIAFAMMGTAVAFGYAAFGPAVAFQLVDKVGEVTTNFVFSAIVLFVFMGSMLAEARIAERLFSAIHVWTAKVPGGLAVTTITMCIVFAATSGIVGATEAVVGLLAVPAMLKKNYNKSLISGSICAGGSLGTIIPPSIIVVVLGPIANVSVGDLMAGILFPGLLMAFFFLTYTVAIAVVKPEYAPREHVEATPFMENVRMTAGALVPPIILIIIVLGSIIGGVAAPSEAGAAGALGTVLLSMVYGTFTLSALRAAVIQTVKVTAMIMIIILAGSIFTGAFIATGGLKMSTDIIAGLNLGPWGVLLAVLFIGFLLGFVLDWISIALILLPIFVPAITQSGFSPEWFCILFLITMQTSYLTPPLAPAIFYLRAIASGEIKTTDMYVGVLPFIGLQLLTLLIVLRFPAIALWLPERLLN